MASDSARAITDYAKQAVAEDFAEHFAGAFIYYSKGVYDEFEKLYPHRAKVLKEILLNLFEINSHMKKEMSIFIAKISREQQVIGILNKYNLKYAHKGEFIIVEFDDESDYYDEFMNQLEEFDFTEVIFVIKFSAMRVPDSLI